MNFYRRILQLIVFTLLILSIHSNDSLKSLQRRITNLRNLFDTTSMTLRFFGNIRELFLQFFFFKNEVNGLTPDQTQIIDSLSDILIEIVEQIPSRWKVQMQIFNPPTNRYNFNIPLEIQWFSSFITLQFDSMITRRISKEPAIRLYEDMINMALILLSKESLSEQIKIELLNVWRDLKELTNIMLEGLAQRMNRLKQWPDSQQQNLKEKLLLQLLRSIKTFQEFIFTQNGKYLNIINDQLSTIANTFKSLTVETQTIIKGLPSCPLTQDFVEEAIFTSTVLDLQCSLLFFSIQMSGLLTHDQNTAEARKQKLQKIMAYYGKVSQFQKRVNAAKSFIQSSHQNPQQARREIDLIVADFKEILYKFEKQIVNQIVRMDALIQQIKSKVENIKTANSQNMKEIQHRKAVVWQCFLQGTQLRSEIVNRPYSSSSISFFSQFIKQFQTLNQLLQGTIKTKVKDLTTLSTYPLTPWPHFPITQASLLAANSFFQILRKQFINLQFTTDYFSTFRVEIAAMKYLLEAQKKKLKRLGDVKLVLRIENTLKGFALLKNSLQKVTAEGQFMLKVKELQKEVQSVFQKSPQTQRYYLQELQKSFEQLKPQLTKIPQLFYFLSDHNEAKGQLLIIQKKLQQIKALAKLCVYKQELNQAMKQWKDMFPINVQTEQNCFRLHRNVYKVLSRYSININALPKPVLGTKYGYYHQSLKRTIENSFVWIKSEMSQLINKKYPQKILHCSIFSSVVDIVDSTSDLRFFEFLVKTFQQKQESLKPQDSEQTTLKQKQIDQQQVHHYRFLMRIYIQIKALLSRMNQQTYQRNLKGRWNLKAGRQVTKNDMSKSADVYISLLNWKNNVRDVLNIYSKHFGKINMVKEQQTFDMMFQKFGLKKLRMSLAELAHKRAQLSLRPNVPLTRQFAKDKKTSLSRSQSAPNLHWLDSAAQTPQSQKSNQISEVQQLITRQHQQGLSSSHEITEGVQFQVAKTDLEQPKKHRERQDDP